MRQPCWRSAGFGRGLGDNDLDQGARPLAMQEAIEYPGIVLARDIPSGNRVAKPTEIELQLDLTTFRPPPLAAKPGAAVYLSLVGLQQLWSSHLFDRRFTSPVTPGVLPDFG